MNLKFKLEDLINPANLVLGFILGLVSITLHVEGVIEKKIMDQSYINRLTNEIKKIVVITEDQQIIYNNGAMELIREFRTEKRRKNSSYETTIVIETKEFLETPPFVECLNDSTIYEAKRGKKYEWIFTPFPSHEYVSFTIPNDEKAVDFYRIEFF